MAASHSRVTSVLNRFATLLLVATSFAPVLFTLAFVATRRSEWITAACYVLAASLLCGLCLMVLKEVANRVPSVAFPVTSVKSADKEIIGFVLSYLLPLVNTSNVLRVDPVVLWFVLTLLGIVAWSTNSYHFNPLLGIFRYHFYEVSTPQSVGFVLISRRDIHSADEIQFAIRLSQYVVLEVPS